RQVSDELLRELILGSHVVRQPVAPVLDHFIKHRKVRQSILHCLVLQGLYQARPLYHEVRKCRARARLLTLQVPERYLLPVLALDQRVHDELRALKRERNVQPDSLLSLDDHVCLLWSSVLLTSQTLHARCKRVNPWTRESSLVQGLCLSGPTARRVRTRPSRSLHRSRSGEP